MPASGAQALSTRYPYRYPGPTGNAPILAHALGRFIPPALRERLDPDTYLAA